MHKFRSERKHAAAIETHASLDELQKECHFLNFLLPLSSSSATCRRKACTVSRATASFWSAMARNTSSQLKGCGDGFKSAPFAVRTACRVEERIGKGMRLRAKGRIQ